MLCNVPMPSVLWSWPHNALPLVHFKLQEAGGQLVVTGHHKVTDWSGQIVFLCEDVEFFSIHMAQKSQSGPELIYRS